MRHRRHRGYLIYLLFPPHKRLSLCGLCVCERVQLYSVSCFFFQAVLPNLTANIVVTLIAIIVLVNLVVVAVAAITVPAVIVVIVAATVVIAEGK